LNSESVVLIDDARLFLCTPPQPHRTEQWPTFQRVLGKLRALSRDHEIMVINDVIVFFPATIADDVSDYASANSIDWLVALRQLEGLKEEHDTLSHAAAERLALVEEMTVEQELLHRALDERLAIIERLEEAVTSRPQPSVEDGQSSTSL
jgi:hypothetical protein